MRAASEPAGAPTGEPAVLPAGRLTRLLDLSPGEWTIDDLAAVFEDRRLRLVSLLHVGADGWLKTLDFVPRDLAHLRDILATGERADGSSLFGAHGIAVTASDVVLRPRLSTAFIDPFAQMPTLAVLCGHEGRDGAPLAESPDTIVRRAAARLRQEAGLELSALGEVEYFLGKQPGAGDVYGSAERGYHASSPFVFGEELRRRALVLLAEIGVPVKYGHSEVGYIEPGDGDDRIWEQHEVELALQSLPEAADAVVLTQWLLRNLAQEQGFRCRFDPILRRGHAGSGLHVHLAPRANGEFLPVSLPGGTLGTEAQWLVAGLVTWGPALMAFGNRVPSSFERLQQAREAPSHVTWGHANRKALVRLPIVARDAEGRAATPETVEFRLPDGSAHPHLLLAAVAQAMLAGREAATGELLRRTAAGERDGRAVGVPRSFAEVARELGDHRAVLEAGDVFPSHVIDRMVQALEA